MRRPRRRRNRSAVTPSAVAGAAWVLWLAAVVSVAAHAAVAVAVWDVPVGRVNVDELDGERMPWRVKRAAYDVVGQRSGNRADEANDQPSLEELSAALLEVVQPPPAELEPQEVELRQVREERQAPADQALPPSNVELPASVLAALEAGRPAELGYQPIESDETGAGGVGGGDGGGAAAAARELLAQSGFAGEGIGGSGAPVGGGASTRQRPTLDQRPSQTPLQPSSVDLANVALQRTLELDVAEHLDDDFDYYVSRFETEGDARGYVQVEIVPKQSLRRLKAMPKDVIFLVDTSSSLPQEWVTEAVRGVQMALRTLNPQDRFNVVLFDEQPSFFSDRGAVEATPMTVQRAVDFVARGQSKGWTDVNAAMSQLLVRDVDRERVYELIFISDGKPTRGVLDTRDLINLITRDNDLSASIYCVGVGQEQNRELLEFLAYRNKGFCVFVDRVDKTADTIRDLMSGLRYPLIKNLRVSVAGAQVDEVYPLNLPNVHQGERFSVYGRYGRRGPFTMRITGSNGAESVDFTFTRDLNLAGRGDASVAKGWAFWKLHHLYSEMLRGDSSQLKAEIERLRKRYGVRTLY